MSVPTWKKEITFHAKGGKNQKGELIGTPQPGDTARIHLVAYQIEYNKPRMGNKKLFGVRKVVQTRIIDSHVIGETAFLSLVMPKPGVVLPGDGSRAFTSVLTQAAQTMALGESAWVHFVTGPDGSQQHFHRGQYETNLPPNTHIACHVDLFRVARNGKENFRPTRNGTGGWAMGYASPEGIWNDLTGNPNRRKDKAPSSVLMKGHEKNLSQS